MSKLTDRTAASARTRRVDRSRADKTSGFEIALGVVYNAFMQWVGRCATAAGLDGFSPFDVVILSAVNRRLVDKRVADICFALKIEDAHTVTYALKKLTNAGLVTSRRVGKEALFSTTDAGRAVCARYNEVRQRFLIEVLSILDANEIDMDEIAGFLHALSGMYEQAARNATTSQALGEP